MRITGGEWCRRLVAVPKSDAIRPTQDRVREALFNMISSEIDGAEFLDLFAGSGAVGLEAISRGAKSATFVEANRRHIETLKKNIKTFGCENRANVVCADAYNFLKKYFGDGFSIAFADPPYALGEKEGYSTVLATLATRGVVRLGGLFIAEMTSAQSVDNVQNWTLLRDRLYGKTRLCLWRREV